MAKAYSRVQRLADFLRRELSSIIQLQLRDPRLGMVSITDVEISKDLNHARIFVTILGVDEKSQAQASINVLNKAAGFLRSEVARISTMRTVPDFSFIFDDSLQRGLKLSALIDNAIKSDQQHD